VEAQSFDRITRRLVHASSRRGIVLGTAVAALGAMASADAGAIAAGCAPDGSHCGKAGDLACCSGWCKRKKGSRKQICHAAPNQGVCTIEDNRCAGDTTACGTGLGGACQCYLTLAGHSFCGNNQYFCLASGPCASDADCAVGLAGTSCVRGGGECSDTPGDSCSVSFCVGPCQHPS
jgi:hypothetical protein